ncbi:MAG: helicase-associated domain-containing protein [Nocardioides sp.]
MPEPPRTLAESLRRWPSENVLALLRERPDLATPAPQDSAHLASRLSTRASITRAVDRLDRAEIALLEAIGTAGPIAQDEVPALVRVEPDMVWDTVLRLTGLALLWEGPGGLRALTEVVGLLTAGSLAESTGRNTAPETDYRKPSLALTARSEQAIDQAAAGAAFDAVRHIEVLLDHWGTRPPLRLRGGGLGMRDLKAAAQLLQADEAHAAITIEVAAAAGLLATGADHEGNPAWLPTDAYDAWAAAPTTERWWLVTRAWLVSPRVIGRAGQKDAQGKTQNALAPELASALQEETRHAVLDQLARVEPGFALASGTGPPSLMSALAWNRPRRPAIREAMAHWALLEGSHLGVLGLTGMSGPGRALLTGDREAAAAGLAPLLPKLIDRVLVQADLTAIAPGPLRTPTARMLHLIADVESRGAATVYRFSAGSIRRGLDAGWTAAELHEFLRTSSSVPIPQPLAYLVDDTARTFGALRVGQADSFIRSDDEVLIAELARHQHAAAWGLRRLAPTVLVSTAPPAVMLHRLREAGAAPVLEAPDGSIHVVRPDLQRTRGVKASKATPAERAARETARLTKVVSAIRAGDRQASLKPPGAAAQGPAAAMAALRSAIEARRSVLIGYVDNDGATTTRVITPIRVDGGWLTAHDERIGGRRSFAVHRVTTVRETPGPETDDPT